MTRPIEEFVKMHNCRLNFDNKWLTFHFVGVNECWEVYQQKYRQKVKKLIETVDLKEALKVLEEK